jgi:hypothetical protein
MGNTGCTGLKISHRVHREHRVPRTRRFPRDTRVRCSSKKEGFAEVTLRREKISTGHARALFFEEGVTPA